MSKAMSAEHLIDVIGVRFDPAAFTAGPVAFNLQISDLGDDGENHVLGVGRSAIHHRPHSADDRAAATVRLDRAMLMAAINGATVPDGVEITGDAEVFEAFVAALTPFTAPALIEP